MTTNPSKTAEPISRKLIVTIAIILLILTGVGVAIFLLTREKSNQNTNNEENQETNTEDNNEEAETLTIPEITLLSSTEAYAKLLEAAKDWAPDAKVNMLQAVTSSIVLGDSREFYGVEAGKYDFWSANIYSASKAEINSVILKNNVAEVSDGVLVDEMLTSVYENQPYINDISSFVSSESVYNTAKAAGLDDENNIYQIYLMYDQTMGKWIFRVDERSKTNLDEYDSPLLVKEYLIDAVTGNLIETE